MEISFKSVGKSYGETLALDNVSFNIKSGDFVLLVGPSGAGKTTIMKLILGQIFATTGDITIDSQPVDSRHRRLDKLRQQIGIVFQDNLLVSDKTIAENIDLVLDINSIPIAKRPEIIKNCLSQVRLGDRLRLFPSQLSAGELQRACLARAISTNPRLILADEPTGNLDAENSWEIIKLIQKYHQTTKTTIILSTHNSDLISSLKYPVIHLASGKTQ